MNVNTNDTQNFVKEQDEVIDIKTWLFRIIKVWPWFLASGVLCLGAAWLYLRYAEPVYEAGASIMIKDEKKGGGSMLDNPLLQELNIGGKGKLVENEIEVLKSIDLLEAAVIKEQLYVSVKNKGRIASWTSYGVNLPFSIEVANPDTIDQTFNWSIDVSNKIWELRTSESGKPFPIKLGEWYLYKNIRYRVWPNILFNAEHEQRNETRPVYLVTLQPVEVVARKLKGALGVKPVSKLASVISLTLQDLHPERGRRTLQAIMEIYSQQGLQDKNLVTTNTIDFLNERLAVVEKELKSVETDVEGFKRANQVTDVSSEAAMYLELAKDIDRQKAEQETKKSIVETLERELMLNQANPNLVPSTLGIAEPSLAILIQRHNELVLQKGRMAERAGAKNPALVDLEMQIKDIRLSLLENVKNLKQAYNISVNDIHQQDSRLRSRISNIPAMEKNLVQISRDRSVKQQIYLYLLQKREESAVTLASTVTDSRTIEKARNQGMVKPKSRMIWMVAGAIALLVPILIIVVLDFFDNRVGNRRDIETACKAPVLGEISFVKNIDSSIQIRQDSRSVVAEQLRSIRTAISFTGNGNNVKTILISSHRPGEGKSFTSLNLAASYALLNKKVVILEFDLRKPRLLKNLGMKKESGISNYLSRGENSLDDMLVEIPGYQGNFWILATGPIPPNPSELILSNRMPEMMAQLREKFDYIILDTPPLSLVTDATLLQQHADLSILVLRQGYTFKDALSYINQHLQRLPGQPLYTVLNGVGKNAKYSYYHAKYAYAGYGYGYVYGEEVKMKGKKEI